MTTTFDASSDHQIREWKVIVEVAVTHIAAEEDDGVIQQGPVAIVRGAHFLQKLREKAYVINLDLYVLLDGIGNILVV